MLVSIQQHQFSSLVAIHTMNRTLFLEKRNQLMSKIIGLILLFTAITSYAIPNPASVYCGKQNFYTFMLADSQGVSSFCVFPDLSYCEQWQYFRGLCQPHQLYWPEKKIDYQHPQKYCHHIDHKQHILITRCKALSSALNTIVNAPPPPNYLKK